MCFKLCIIIYKSSIILCTFTFGCTMTASCFENTSIEETNDKIIKIQVIKKALCYSLENNIGHYLRFSC